MHTALWLVSLCIGLCRCAVFRLYTAEQGSTNAFLLTPMIDSLTNSTFDGRRKTVLLIHGFTQSHASRWVTHLRQALHSQENVNVITADWSADAQVVVFKYPAAARSIRRVGGEVALLVAFLVRNARSSASLFHLVGFSLGAHTAGFAGTQLQHVHGMRIGRITGLDPAGPLFNDKKAEAILDASDADFVDVIHTSMMSLGINRHVGHIDFYPNGGSTQPGCGPLLDPRRIQCDHRRATVYFIESVSSRHSFPSYPCKNLQDFDHGRCLRCGGAGQCPSMGYYANTTKEHAAGKHFLFTNKSPPFSAHHYLLQFHTGEKWPMARIYVRMTGAGGLDTGEVELKRHGDSAETYVMPSPVDVGDLTRIRLRVRVAWFLLYVVARPAWSDVRYTAYFNTRWKGTMEKPFIAGDGSTTRYILN